MRMIELTMVVSETRPQPELFQQPAEDDLGMPTEHAAGHVAQPAPAWRTTETAKIMINADKVRSFAPRKEGRQGTRVVFDTNAAQPVTETYEEVAAKFAALNN